MNIKSLKGTQDILPQEIKLWRQIEEASRRIFSIYGYGEIRTPIIEEAALFMRSVGEESDIVKKQMYAFKDQGGRNICLRPEETASVARAYIEQSLDKKEGFVKLFYIGPMFRSERPQAGRLRQFHQIGVEAIGSYSPYLDAEVIIMLDDLLKNYGVKDYTININLLGCESDKKVVRQKLKELLKQKKGSLCEDCIRRYDTNILRILDCKEAACRKVVYELIPLLESLQCGSCKDDFNIIKGLLDESSVKYKISPLIVRGLDYYTKTVFEVTAEGLGAQNAIAAGGRYDNLISDFGGQKTGACGFAIGVERVIEALSDKAPKPIAAKRESVFIVTLGEDAYKQGFKILRSLRKFGISCDIDYQQKSLKAQMRYADKLNAKYAVIIGEDELREGNAVIKDMENGSQKKVVLNKIIGELKC